MRENLPINGKFQSGVLKISQDTKGESMLIDLDADADSEGSTR